MKTKTLGIVASLAMAVSSQAAVLTYTWEEVGSDVTVTMSGSLDVAGWTTGAFNIDVTAAAFYNFGDSSSTTQSFQVNRNTSGGVTYNNTGTLVLSPWGTPTGANFGTIPFESGSFAGHIYILVTGGNPSAFLQTSQIVNDVYTVDAVYRISDTTLAGLFGDGLSAWSSGETIATIGNNEIRFQAVPEPSASALVFGVGALALFFWRRSSKV